MERAVSVLNTVQTRTVCHYLVATHLGGAERSTLDLLCGLKERTEMGFQPWAIVPKDSGPLIDEFKKNGIPFDVVPMPAAALKMSRADSWGALKSAMFSSLEMIAYLRKVRKLLLARKPAVIHTHAVKCHAAASIVGAMTGIPVLWHLRDLLSHGFAPFLLRRCKSLGRVTVIANSKASAEAFAPGDLGIKVVHNGLDPRRYTVNRNRYFNEKLNLSPEVPIIGIVGVLARWKGQFEFLQMAEKLIRSGSSARFAVIGAEIYDTSGESAVGIQLRKEAQRLNIENYVYFAGYMKDAAQVMNGLDILVHASIKPEPFGRTVIEAMACGVPVVASGAGGILETVQAGKNGLLYPPGDVLSMTSEVRKLLADQEMRVALAKEGHKNFQRDFSIQKHVDRISEVYSELIKA